MSVKSVIRILAGPASITAILMLVLLLSLGGAELLSSKKQIGLRIGADVALAKANALAEAVLDGSVDDVQGTTFHARRIRDAADGAALASSDERAALALKALRGNSTQPFSQFYEADGKQRLYYAVSDGTQGALVLDIELERERAAIGRTL